jgi:hypothetical protein
MGRNGFLASIQQAGNLVYAQAWLAWRGERVLPRRADLDLRAIRHLLPTVMLFEVPTPDMMLVRVAGTGLREHFGFELTGRNYIELAPPEQRATRRHRTWASIRTPCGSRLVREHKLTGGRVTLAEVVSLPFDGDGPDAPRLLLSHVAPYANRYDPNVEPAVETFGIAGDFTFLDLGVGVPDSSFAAAGD